MNDKEVFEYNNEEEAEVAQIQALFANQNAVDNVRKQLAKQAELPSAECCEDCGEDIPEQRRKLVPGVQLCIYCQTKLERFKANYRQPGGNSEL
jgi:phage/conjugal plasmid C-4 type zinc finger TraR family protein